MHDVLRQRLIRKIESLPDAQVYQILDYIEFLESKYAVAEAVEASGLQKFAEGLEDKLRKKSVSPSTIREAFQLISAADRVLSGVSSAGRQILTDLGEVLEPPERPAEGHDGIERIEADPRKSRSGSPGGRAPTRGSAAGTGADSSGSRGSTGSEAGAERDSSSGPTRSGGRAPTPGHAPPRPDGEDGRG